MKKQRVSKEGIGNMTSQWCRGESVNLLVVENMLYMDFIGIMEEKMETTTTNDRVYIGLW